MTKRYSQALLFFSLFFSLAVVASPPKKEITWLIPPSSGAILAPASTKNGEAKLSLFGGAISDVLRTIEQATPQYIHKYKVVNILRAMEMFRKGDEVCALMILPSASRKEIALFGAVAAYIAPAGIALNTKDEKVQSLLTQNQLSLKSLIADKKFKMGMSAGRVFSPIVDEELAKLDAEKIYRYHGSNSSVGLFNMLKEKRVNGVVSYFSELDVAEKSNSGPRQFVFKLFKESKDLIGLTLSCSSTAWGREMIKELNPIIRKNKKRTQENLLEQHKKTMPKDLYQFYVDAVKAKS